MAPNRNLDVHNQRRQGMRYRIFQGQIFHALSNWQAMNLPNIFYSLMLPQFLQNLNLEKAAAAHCGKTQIFSDLIEKLQSWFSSRFALNLN